MTTPHDAGENWDTSDVEALRSLRAEGLSYRRIALRLGRTTSAIASKLHWLRARGIVFPKGSA